MFQNTKHLRKVLFSSAIQNTSQIQDFASVDPATLIKMGLRQNSLELFNSLRDRLKFCKYEMISDYRNLIKYVQRSHINQFLDRQSYDNVIANQFSENLINSHMIWLSYIIMEEKDYMTPLRNLESVWYKNVLYLNIKQIYAVLTFYEKFNLFISERTLYQMLKMIHKQQKNYKDFQIIYHCLQIISKQQNNLKNDPLFLDIQNNISTKIKETYSQAKIIENINFFLIHPLEDLSTIKEGLKSQTYQLTSLQMKYLLTIIQNTLLNNPSFNQVELNYIISKLQELFNPNNTLSNKFQLSLLQKLIDEGTDLSKFDLQVDYLKINDLHYLLKLRQLMKNYQGSSSEDLKHFIFKFLLKTMQNRRIYCVDFDHFHSITGIIEQNQEYNMLLKPFREFMGVYSFLF